MTLFIGVGFGSVGIRDSASDFDHTRKVVSLYPTMHNLDLVRAIASPQVDPSVRLLNVSNLVRAWLVLQNPKPSLPSETWTHIFALLLSNSIKDEYITVVGKESSDQDDIVFQEIQLPEYEDGLDNQEDVESYQKHITKGLLRLIISLGTVYSGSPNILQFGGTKQSFPLFEPRPTFHDNSLSYPTMLKSQIY